MTDRSKKRERGGEVRDVCALHFLCVWLRNDTVMRNDWELLLFSTPAWADCLWCWPSLHRSCPPSTCPRRFRSDRPPGLKVPGWSNDRLLACFASFLSFSSPFKVCHFFFFLKFFFCSCFVWQLSNLKNRGNVFVSIWDGICFGSGRLSSRSDVVCQVSRVRWPSVFNVYTFKKKLL